MTKIYNPFAINVDTRLPECPTETTLHILRTKINTHSLYQGKKERSNRSEESFICKKGP